MLNYDISEQFLIKMFNIKGRVQKLKSATVWSLTIKGGEGVTQNQILIQTSFYSVNFAIVNANLKNSE